MLKAYVSNDHRKIKYSVVTLLALCGSSLLFSTVAHARPSTKSYTCSGVKKLVSKRGAVVLNTKSSSVYRRFVANRSFCNRREETTKSYTVPTKSGKCRLKICYEPMLINR